MEKFKKTIVTKNYKKSIIHLLIAAVVLVAVAAGTGYAVFGARVQTAVTTMHQQEQANVETLDKNDDHTYEADEKHENDRKEGRDHENDHEKDHDIEDMIQFTTGDMILIGAFGLIGVGMAAYFAVLILMMITKHAFKVCSECGNIQKRDTDFCGNCGAAFDKICPECGYHAKKADEFCKRCGKKFEK